MTSLADIETPFVAVDLDRVMRNIDRWQGYLDRHGIGNRPHIKTHKLVSLARLQLEKGAMGIACQKLGEAEVMVEGLADRGPLDLMIPYNILGNSKLQRAAALSKQCRLTLACDNEAMLLPMAQAMQAAGSEVGLVIEFDSGAGRCGVATIEEALALAKLADSLPAIRFEGLMTYPPTGGAAKVRGFFEDAAAMLAESGIETRIRSNGGSPDMWKAHEVTNATEHRAGTYIYFDRMQEAAGSATFEDCALSVHATVVSRHGDRACIDAGSKSLTSDMGGLAGHGLIREYPLAVIRQLSEEHGHVDLSASSDKPRIGERITIIPNHVCPVSNLFDEVVLTMGAEVVGSQRVDARGQVT
ncbi:MAG: alanine racemase [Geminicoccaceae bacterium]|nr:alanine racemase [Geminicoccaceae bacterium]